MKRNDCFARWRRSLLIAGGILAGTVLESGAVMTAGVSGGAMSSLDLAGLGGLVAGSFTIGSLDGSSPPPYNLSLSGVDLAASETDLLVDLYSQSGTGSIVASSEVDGIDPLPRAVSAMNAIGGLSLSLLKLPFQDPLVWIGTGDGMLGSSASVSGSSLFDVGVTASSSLAGLEIEILGASLDLSAFLDGSGNAAPNSQITQADHGIPGLTITLNEQIDLGDNLTAFGRQVTAVHVNFDEVGFNVTGLDSVSGDVYLARSYALGTIPEPSGLVLGGLAAALLCMGRARK